MCLRFLRSRSIILLHLKILQILPFLMWKSFSGAIFWKPLFPTTNQRTANGRSIFPLEKTVLISKIGQREPLSFSVWKFLVEVAFKNGAFWASEPWIKIRQSNIVETFALVQLFTIVVNFKSATCFTSHTFALRCDLWWRAPTTKLLMFGSSFRAHWIPDRPAMCIRSGLMISFSPGVALA